MRHQLSAVLPSFLIALLTLAPTAFAQVTQEWIDLYDNITGHDNGRAVVIDSDGNVIVTGSSLGFVPGYDYTYEYGTLKYDGDGTLLWEARYNGPGFSFNDDPVGVGVDAAGNVYVSGSSPGDGTDLDIATVKYDPEGTEMWVRRWNGPSNRTDGASDMAVDPDGNVYVTGGSYSPGSVTDMITLKYDTDGNLLWDTVYSGGYGTDAASALAVDGDGNVTITGESIRSSGFYDWATIRYDADGNEQWVRFVDGTQHSHDYAHAIALDANGNARVSGYTVTAGNYVLTTAAYDIDGNELWVTYAQMGEVGSSIAVDGDGNCLVGCWSGLVLSYDPDGAERWTTPFLGGENGWARAQASTVDAAGNWYLTGYRFDGNEELRTVKLDPSGAEVWSIEYAGPAGDDVGLDIALAANGDVIVAGTSNQGTPRDNDYCTIRYAQPSAGAPSPASGPLRLVVASNPFRRSTVLRFNLPRPATARLEVFDLRGRLLRRLVAEHQSAGLHAVTWDGRDAAGLRLASGTYVARLSAGELNETRKLQLLR